MLKSETCELISLIKGILVNGSFSQFGERHARQHCWRCFCPFSFNKLLGNCDRFLFHNCTSWLKGRYNKFVPKLDVHFNQLRAPIVSFPALVNHFFSVIAGVSNLSEKSRKIFRLQKDTKSSKVRFDAHMICAVIIWLVHCFFSMPEDKRDFSFHHCALDLFVRYIFIRLASSFR